MNKSKKESEKEVGSSPMIALRDFIICHNEHLFKIKEGDDIIKLGVPQQFHINLKTENVIK
ncbi:MAG: hypothetical protein ACUZ8E_17930 [Candidatus Anammoxibacter sp.]